MLKKIFHKIAPIIPVMLIALFCLISATSLYSISNLQGNARVINYAGIVRGATQRLIKQELHHIPNDALIQHLDEIIAELSYGNGDNDLVVLPSPSFQSQMGKIRTAWNEMKIEIHAVRQNADPQRLFNLSEDYFELADETVLAAEVYSESRIHSAINRLIALNIAFIVLVSLFWIYDQRQKKMNIALKSAENANQAKSDFLSRMSHEIRTPMNGIMGMTAIARMSRDDPDKLVDCLDKIELSSSYLMALINDILDMSRIESGKVELYEQDFDLLQLAERLRTMFQQKAEDAGIQFQIDTDSLTVNKVIGDDLRISQIIINLVTNALKFTPSGGCVTVRIRQTNISEENITLEFEIQDTGIGMSEEFQSKLFQPFEQEKAATAHQYGGTGLGLAISYNFIKMMNGDIVVHSRPGNGSQFIVRLTLRCVPKNNEEALTEQPVQCPEIHGFNFTGTKILLAEDNEINSEIATALLENVGAEVTPVWNGKEALDVFSRSNPGQYKLILMDIQMPCMDGLEASRLIRSLKRPDAKTIPILGLSANVFRHDVDQAIACGMNGYLAKPINIEKLLQAICRYMQS